MVGLYLAVLGVIAFHFGFVALVVLLVYVGYFACGF